MDVCSTVVNYMSCREINCIAYIRAWNISDPSAAPCTGLIELREAHMGPLRKAAKVPPDGIPAVHHVNRTTQLGVTGKLALNPTVCVADKDIK
ncbi:hypothetical protein BTVI_79323 [Pitangus sulphuratus]|nr:hypothetical protein BTVI_79323 [Pitangus sulphuratus]